ncbi:MAG: lysine--tRNA ligase [Geodermatophilaceae bacterium]|nr:lysine--tRNA ligase [Geodermatophilaceae bacterium]
MSTEQPGEHLEFPEQLRVRREKLERLRESGIDPFPPGAARTHTLAEVRDLHPDMLSDTSTGHLVGVTGRVIFLRNTGRLCFATLREGGVELQVMLSLDRVGEHTLRAWKADVDLGDQLFVEGEVVTSRRGELSVLAESWAFTSKALRPLPVAHRPMNEETRVRQRYVELIVRDEARRIATCRVDVVRSLRATLHERDFMEVETPMLQPLHGGATARPFTTHMNAFDMELYLRIAPELYLKRCIVGGLDKVFEINRNFRNEGVDRTHNPEFAMLEVYEAYSDYNGMAALTRELIQNAAMAAFGSLVVRHADGTDHDFGGEWPSITLYGAVSEALGEQVTPETSPERLRAYAEANDIAVHPAWGPGRLVEELLEHLVVPGLVAPTFVRDFPQETSPLTRDHRVSSGLSEKWDLYVGAVETATAYSELTDPILQRARFMEQARLAAAGDPEAMVLDEDFLTALEYGMPPVGGMGMGIDRMLMAFTGLGVRDTILFPLVRPY